MRWRKLWAELAAARGRVSAMVVALAVSLAGLGVVLGARAVLLREMTASYVGTRPADATLELPDGVSPELLAAVRARGETAAAREVIAARVGGPGGTRGILLFATDGDDAAPVNQLRVQAGAWPPATGRMAVERTALPVLGVADGDTVTITTPHGAPRPVRIAGVVHDPALAPAWQEHRGYGYLTRQTLAALGEPDVLHQLCVRFSPEPPTQADAEARAMALARWLGERGHAVREVRVPPLRRHPHAGQMAAIQLILLVFGALLVGLSAILIATLLAALLARQVRELGVMKTLGARTWQLAVGYAGFVGVIGALALVLALPLAYLGAHAFITGVAGMLNLAVDDPSIPPGVFGAVAGAGLVLPLAAAAVPILRACRRSVRDALADHGTRAQVRAAPAWLPHAARNALRTPARLALSLGLLAAAGALTMTAFNVKRAYEHTVQRMPAMWRYDVDLRLAEPAPGAPGALAAALSAVPGVRRVEAWSDTTAAWPRPELQGPDLVHTYPDQGHGRFHVFGAPPDTQLARLPLVAGRWLTPGDTDAIVVSVGHGGLGQRLTLSLDGQPSTWTVVGVVDPVPAGSAFVAARAPATLFRVAFIAGADPARTIAVLSQTLQTHHAALAAVEPLPMLRAALDDHVVIISRAAIVIAGIMALVGLLGLAAALGIAVVERTRELGIYKTLGAGAGHVARLIVGEAVAVALASWLLAALLSIPATLHVDELLGRQGFLAADFVISPGAALAWLLIVVAGSAAASYLPARRAARLTVRAALAST
ncbi:MAG TPA: FtsX-like permease family protein [Kofleriaceae bacterium]